jgi:hypothetical protein
MFHGAKPFPTSEILARNEQPWNTGEKAKPPYSDASPAFRRTGLLRETACPERLSQGQGLKSARRYIDVSPSFSCPKNRLSERVSDYAGPVAVYLAERLGRENELSMLRPV